MGTSVTPNFYNFLIRIDPFDKLPQAVVESLSDKIKVQYLVKGETIHFSALCEQRFLYVVRRGAIEQLTPSGELRARLGKEDQFGFTFLEPLTNSEDGYQAQAIQDTLLYLIPHEALKDICRSHPEFEDSFAAQAKTRLHSAVRSICREHEKGLFFRNVEDVASGNITIVDADISIGEVAKKMCTKPKSSCAVVMSNDEIVGLVTDRDMTKRVVAAGVDHQLPVHRVMTPSPILIQGEEKVIQAVSLMLQYNIRCLPVLDGDRVKGLLTTTHLVHNHRTQSLFLIEKIKYSSTVAALADLKDEKRTVFQALVESGVSSEIQGRVMSMIMDAFTRRIIQLAEEELGPPPCDYSWMVAGSHARNEVHMLSDQDSALILTDEATAKDREYFNQLAHRVSEGLDKCGYVLCTGKYMASSPEWCQPVSVWKKYYQKWVNSPEYSRLLSISVFLEVRSIYGKSEFVDQIQQHLHQCIQNSHQFIPSLVRDAINTKPPLGIFNNLVLEKSGTNSNTLNIKKYALNLIIDLARIFSLAAGSTSTGTEERFRFATDYGTLSPGSCENIIGAFRFITQVRFRHQLDAINNNQEPDNHIAPDQFSSFERKHLKEAFKIISELQDVARIKFLQGYK